MSALDWVEVTWGGLVCVVLALCASLSLNVVLFTWIRVIRENAEVRYRAVAMGGFDLAKPGTERSIVAWKCLRCGRDVEDGRCGCESSPSPWEPVSSFDVQRSAFDVQRSPSGGSA